MTDAEFHAPSWNRVENGGVFGIGIVGTGNMGADHARRVRQRTENARLAALYDADPQRRAALARETGARGELTAQAVIEAADVDAVIVASPSQTHADYVLACIAAGKPVLCEKPLAPTVEACQPILEAEQAAGRRLVVLGYMRRFDAGYQALKSSLDDGSIGTVRAVHCIHRNRSAPNVFSAAQTLTESVVHEIDVVRWLLGEEIVAVTVLPSPRRRLASDGLVDPLLVVLETESGVLIDVEAHVTAGYGYDVRCEVVGSAGYATLGVDIPRHVTVASAPSLGIPDDWLGRFGQAYDAEVQAWVDALGAGTHIGASAWDGYVSAIVAAACVRSLESDARVAVLLPQRPTLYWGRADGEQPTD